MSEVAPNKNNVFAFHLHQATPMQLMALAGMYAEWLRDTYKAVDGDSIRVPASMGKIAHFAVHGGALPHTPVYNACEITTAAAHHLYQKELAERRWQKRFWSPAARQAAKGGLVP